MDAVSAFGDSTGVAGAGAFAETDGGTGVEDATGVGKDEAVGATALTDCGLATGAWPNALSVKKLSALRIKETLFISNVILIKDCTRTSFGLSIRLTCFQARLGSNYSISC